MTSPTPTAFLVVLTLLAGCAGLKQPPITTDFPIITGEVPLDSCVARDKFAIIQPLDASRPNDTLDSPHPGSWTDLQVVGTDRYTLTIPAVAIWQRSHEEGVWSANDFPLCRYWCSVSVTIEPDSTGGGVAGSVTRIRADYSPIESENLIGSPGPSIPIRVGPLKGTRLDMPCGDCGSIYILAGRGKELARIEINIDDREGFTPGLTCRLLRVAQSFRFRE
jgi:hypothetical protein